MDDWREDLQTFGHNFELYPNHHTGHIELLTFNTVSDSLMFSRDGQKLVFASNRDTQKPRLQIFSSPTGSIDVPRGLLYQMRNVACPLRP